MDNQYQNNINDNTANPYTGAPPQGNVSQPVYNEVQPVGAAKSSPMQGVPVQGEAVQGMPAQQVSEPPQNPAQQQVYQAPQQQTVYTASAPMQQAGQTAQVTPDVMNKRAVKKAKKKNTKESPGKLILRIVISVLLIGLGIYLILFLVARAAMYDTIGSMLNHMWIELQVMWQRIIS